LAINHLLYKFVGQISDFPVNFQFLKNLKKHEKLFQFIFPLYDQFWILFQFVGSFFQ